VNRFAFVDTRRIGNVLRSKISAEELLSAIAQTITDSGSPCGRPSTRRTVARGSPRAVPRTDIHKVKAPYISVERPRRLPGR
jgi:hypothetical protein